MSTTHFGFREVPVQEKVDHVRKVFESVAPKYDLMNDLMSGGVHRLWKRYTVARARFPKGGIALDVGGGTGDLALLLRAKGGDHAKVVVYDINHEMLKVGRDRVVDKGHLHDIEFCQGDAETIALPDDSFDVVTIGFCLRNVTTPLNALKEMHRVLKPGGQFLCLEFSKPVLPVLDKLYDLYSFNAIPKIGELITGDRDSYQYLVESIRRFPPQAELGAMMEQAGFFHVTWENLTGGVAALHVGYKI
ncbi:MAG: bifunctional demethylmenaquinone methyltransferase/2-methoxy-6-polyprenyl-1,4-benzoquinol methylase UbiE [Alphaproteobacteria bacterium CG_4_10_14_0_2_um_filter_63_37]|nr:MAG: bifunctional demethylmenaquinone methyltransferase/2-methoxy-6-polyprenyl-1,4-benzoquinol methylase [Proteobacteria bacterium CG1_02_64_396]PJA23622.1 MAG: bifunctional demethylmenaquinone methyltransferase/2-methoxy-6-polyprenyl-1,4-benzoquinol methylase UbiE [Alphaproteobacteria bacterium CG_4_10_14_0_2_um_filter_63_37]